MASEYLLRVRCDGAVYPAYHEVLIRFTHPISARLVNHTSEEIEAVHALMHLAGDGREKRLSPMDHSGCLRLYAASLDLNPMGWNMEHELPHPGDMEEWIKFVTSARMRSRYRHGDQEA